MDNIMKFFDYIFFRSYSAAMKSKFKNNAEPRSLALLVFIQGSILAVVLMIALKILGHYEEIEISNRQSHNISYLIILPLVFLLWHLNERHYSKKSNDNYALLSRQFKNSIYNKIVPFWIIFLSPFILIFGVPFILSIL